MTTANTDALKERIEVSAREVMRRSALIADVDLPAYLAAAVLPIVEAEVRKAKAEALREAAGDIVWSAETLPHMTPHDAARGLVRRADRIETGDSDERR